MSDHKEEISLAMSWLAGDWNALRGKGSDESIENKVFKAFIALHAEHEALKDRNRDLESNTRGRCHKCWGLTSHYCYEDQEFICKKCYPKYDDCDFRCDDEGCGHGEPLPTPPVSEKTDE